MRGLHHQLELVDPICKISLVSVWSATLHDAFNRFVSIGPPHNAFSFQFYDRQHPPKNFFFSEKRTRNKEYDSCSTTPNKKKIVGLYQYISQGEVDYSTKNNNIFRLIIIQLGPLRKMQQVETRETKAHRQVKGPCLMDAAHHANKTMLTIYSTLSNQSTPLDMVLKLPSTPIPSWVNILFNKGAGDVLQELPWTPQVRWWVGCVEGVVARRSVKFHKFFFP